MAYQKTPDHIIARIRAMYLAGVTLDVIAARLRVSTATIKAHTRDLPARDVRGVARIKRQERCIVVGLHGVDELITVQPTGRMEFCASYLSPERQWHFEVFDTRDGKVKLLPFSEIRSWSQACENAPPIEMMPERRLA